MSGTLMKKDREFYGLGKNDRLLFLSGVPLTCLKNPVTPKDLNFSFTSYRTVEKTVTISIQRQQQVLLDLLDNIDQLGESGLFAIGSHPTEQAGYDLAAMLSIHFFNSLFKEGQLPEVKWIDLGRPDLEFLLSDEPCDLCVIHGLSNTSDDRRCDKARDFIHRTEYCTTILVASTDQILKFMVSKMKTSPEIVWQLSKTTHEVYL